MREIILKNQRELDELKDFDEPTIIIINSGENWSISRRVKNVRFNVSGSAKISNVSGSAEISNVSGNAKISYVFEDAKISYVSGKDIVVHPFPSMPAMARCRKVFVKEIVNLKRGKH